MQSEWSHSSLSGIKKKNGVIPACLESKKRMDIFATYIMGNKRPTLYTGMTNDLIKRVWQHKHKVNKTSFTARYNLNILLYFETFDTAIAAIIREKQIKNMKRDEKIELVKKMNPNFNDLYEGLL